jgi:hypothetical protein
VTAPEQTVVHQQSVSTSIDGRFYESATGGHTRDDFLNLGAALHLQAVRAVVFEFGRLQQIVAQTQELIAVGHVSAVPF